ncbi:MAG TPA: roadblock/LC7 domain-containing protein [Ilumatobacteraceae bacterium]|nr:roadblock/LC7 domain-containing protein [Ilumatobacteraceae bacterium]
MEKVKAAVGGPPPVMTSGFVPPRRPAASGAWTAPATHLDVAPAAPTPSAPTPSGPTPWAATPPQPEAVSDPVAVLDELTEQVDGVTGAILASADGFGLARSTSMADEPSHPAMLAAAVGLGHQLVAMGGGETLRQLVVDHDAGLMLVWPIGADRILAVLASRRVDQRALRSAVQQYAPTLAGATA